MTKECPKGTILRVSYIKKSGTKVPAKCIKAQSFTGKVFGKKRTEIDKKIMSKLNKIHEKAREKFGTPKCKSGEIIREGYLKNGKLVAPTCINKISSKEKGKQLFVLEKGKLKKFGYENVKTLSKTERQKALTKALNEIPPKSLMRRINALSLLNKNKNPDLSRTFKADVEFIQNTPKYKKSLEKN